ncbi:MAG TPA: hypothetical protein VGQ61_05950 [Candidatus Angelobacter sp.]|jgi:hypothetical protein|nr:hypothetical protein [Candidatus Angelobacter sp.]
MFHRRLRLAISLVGILAGVSAGERTVLNDQSPRQALIEMLSGGEAPFKKHLTVEMQGKLQNLMKASLDNAPSPLQVLLGVNSSTTKFQAFDIGPILFAFYNPQEHQRYEITIDREDRRGDQDIMELSLHLVRNAQEKEVPGSLRFVVNMKRQESIWRLNSLTMNATLPMGDPRILEKSWWSPMIAAAMGPTDDVTADAPVVMDERPKMTPLRAVRMIGMAETIYAQKHPGLGYTCALSDLVNVGRGMDEEGMYTFMGADIADGVYNGYRFALSGCEHKPARMFRVTAEPLTGKGKAYCSDSSSNPRASDDGRGVTCLISGKIARK